MKEIHQPDDWLSPDRIETANVNQVGPLDGGVAGGRAIPASPDWYIRGHPCPKCGGCDFYCADCVYPLLAALQSVAKAARALRENGKVGRGADARWGALIDALDAYDAL